MIVRIYTEFIDNLTHSSKYVLEAQKYLIK